VEGGEQRADLGLGFGEFVFRIGAGDDAGAGVQFDVLAVDQG